MYRTGTAGNCPECAPGDWAITSETAVPAGASAAVVVALPPGARFTGYRYEAVDGWGGGDCVADQPCVIADARWQGHPSIDRASGTTTLTGTFTNASTSRERRARLTAFFHPAAGWKPPGG